MAEQSLYSVLGLPPSATELDIRVSYLHKLARIRSGLLASDQRPAIERAYETLQDPEKRFRYDLHFAAYSQSAGSRFEILGGNGAHFAAGAASDTCECSSSSAANRKGQASWRRRFAVGRQPRGACVPNVFGTSLPESPLTSSARPCTG
jgi:DnaJ-class molecular chaperone